MPHYRNNRPGKTALVVEGGGMRGVFSSGVLYAFGRFDFKPFDLYIGVSAGACNLASHLAGQNTRNFDIIERYSATKNFINPWRFLRGGHLMDLDWLWDITIRQYRLDLKNIFAKKKYTYIVVVTSMESGKPLYLEPDESTLEFYLKASSSLPLLYRTTLEIEGEKVTDGGIADSIPAIEAYRRGARRIMVLRSRPASYIKTGGFGTSLLGLLFRKYPEFRRAVINRAAAYNEAVNFIHNPPDDAEIIEIAPPETMSTGRTTRKLALLRRDYNSGIRKGMETIKAYEKWAE